MQGKEISIDERNCQQQVNIPNSEDVYLNPTKDLPYHCDLCGYVLSSLDSLDIYKLIHGEKVKRTMFVKNVENTALQNVDLKTT
jgi:hypothetical protein